MNAQNQMDWITAAVEITCHKRARGFLWSWHWHVSVGFRVVLFSGDGKLQTVTLAVFSVPHPVTDEMK